MANDDFQKGAEKKSGVLGLNAGILKANQEREDRIKEEKIKFAKYLIEDMELVRIVLDNVNEGRNRVEVQFPGEFDPNAFGTDYFSPDGLLENYHDLVTEAIDSDGITWSMVVEEMKMMMEAEGVSAIPRISKHALGPGNPLFFQLLSLSWPELD